MNEREVIFFANFQLIRAFVVFSSRHTPQGDEYARRALKALKCLRAGDGKGCEMWTNLVLTK